MRLRTADVDRYGPLYDYRPPCSDGLTVISGPNESGKTLYLEALLQLLEPGVGKTMTPQPRVDGDPTGRVVVEHAGEPLECDGDDSLSDVTAIEPSHLETVFVVRDADLALPDSRDYYTSLVERLGDVHTAEISRITDALKDRGRLTDARLNVSSDQRHDGAGDVRDDAAELAADVREYVQTVEEEGLDELERRRLRRTRDLRTLREALDRKQDAATLAKHASLSARLETYRETADELARLSTFDKETLEDLREAETMRTRDAEDLANVEDEIRSTLDRIEVLERELDDCQAELAALDRRSDAVADAKTALERHRSARTDTAGVERRLALAKPATLAALAGSGVVGAIGAMAGSTPAFAVAALLFVVGFASAVAYVRASRVLADAETAEAEVLDRAHDAGFEVDAVDAVAPAIESFENERQGARTRETTVRERLDRERTDLEEERAERDALRASIAERDEFVRTELKAVDVDSVDAYADRVDLAAELETEHSTARQSLVDAFGEPSKEGGTRVDDAVADRPDSRTVDDALDAGDGAGAWARELDRMVACVDAADVSVNDHDPDRLAELEAEIADCERDIDTLEATLETHDDAVDRFAARTAAINATPFVGDSITLEARSADGLRSLADALEDLVETIERDAEVSRKALSVFDAIEREEHQQLETLFAPDGVASTTFERLTDGAYESVTYDPSEHEIVVENASGRTLTPDALSHGTRDQLYFATRVSLAQQLLGTEPGFLLLDDPFLAADPARLRNGFETLRALADQGWQLLYLTAKAEVSDEMVDEYDLPHVELDALADRH